jgi:predicted transcriptional regulator
METKRTIQRTDETQSWFFEQINKIYKSLAKLTKGKREKTQINKIRDEKVNITTNANEILRILGEYFKSLYSNKLEKSR